MSVISQFSPSGPHGLLATTNNSNVAASTGAPFCTNDGRILKYVFAGATDIPGGVLVQSPAAIADHQGLSGSTQAIGDKVVTVTLGATLATQGEYSSGFLETVSGTGAGQKLRITTNAAAALSTTCLITLEDAFWAAVDNTTTYNLILNPYLNVIINPTTPTGSIIGTTIAPIPAGNGAYIAVGGINTVKFDAVGSTAINVAISPSTTVAGAVTANSTTAPVLGFTVEATVASTYGSAYLQL